MIDANSPSLSDDDDASIVASRSRKLTKVEETASVDAPKSLQHEQERVENLNVPPCLSADMDDKKLPPSKKIITTDKRTLIENPRRMVTPGPSFSEEETVATGIAQSIHQTNHAASIPRAPPVIQHQPVEMIDDEEDSSSDSDATDVHVCVLEQPTRCDIVCNSERGLVIEKRTSFGRRWMALLVSGLFLSCVLLLANARRPWVDDPQAVYAPGAGFSGFWFTLGRLQSIPDLSERSFYCFSAGCIGVVAALGNHSMEEIYEKAYDAQTKWKGGHISRHDIVEYFLNDLLYGNPLANASSPPQIDASVLHKVNIITTARVGAFGLKTEIRTPTNLEELHEMLLQTTWIPFAVGSQLWHYGADGVAHMDGAFLAFTHPRCGTNLGLANDLDLILNILNVNLGRDKVEKLWNAGLSHGL